MDRIDLDREIVQYVNQKETLGAIMITAPWGSGKSYYIQNHLTIYLKDEGYVKECVVVSLYSLSTLDDLCKAILFNYKFKELKSSSKKSEAVEIVASTLFRGILSYCNIDFGADDEIYKKMMGAVDFSGVLLILEDVERSNIRVDILMGFVNNLTEIDGVKILLVSNEDEIKCDDSNYCRIKEKAVFDTLYFDYVSSSIVKSVLEQYAVDDLGCIIENDVLEKYVL